MQAAKALLAEAEAYTARNSVAFLDSEFRNIDRMLLTLPRQEIIQHSITLPYGTMPESILPRFLNLSRPAKRSGNTTAPALIRLETSLYHRRR